jgi:hypothetical protein
MLAKHKKAGFTALVLRPLWRFIHRYVLRRGFLDGKLGFILCSLSCFYVFTKYAKLWYYTTTNTKPD